MARDEGNVIINSNPYQGLKRLLGESCLFFPQVIINSNPYQGLKLHPCIPGIAGVLVIINSNPYQGLKLQLDQIPTKQIPESYNQLESLSGIETYTQTLTHLEHEVIINSNPYQGLKLEAIALMESFKPGYNQLESLSGIETWKSWGAGLQSLLL